MAININRLTNANCYVDGNSLLGQVEEASLPDIKKVMSEHKGLGMIGKLEFPSGIDKLDAKLKFNSFYPDVMKSAAGFNKAVKLQLRSSSQVYQGGDMTSEKPYVVFMTGQFTNFPAGAFKAMDNVEIELNVSITAIRIEYDRQEVLNYDANANIYIVDGVDQLSEYRANLGI